MAEIVLTPELLMSQSAEMQSLQTEYESLFGQVTNVLNGMNDSWSTNIASNFAGKILLAQKSFSSIVNMMQNGSTAAKVGAMTFADGVGMSDILHSFGDMTEADHAANYIYSLSQKGVKEASEIMKYMKKEKGSRMGMTEQEVIEVAKRLAQGDYKGALQYVINGDGNLHKSLHSDYYDWIMGSFRTFDNALASGNLKPIVESNNLDDIFWHHHDDAIDATQIYKDITGDVDGKDNYQHIYDENNELFKRDIEKLNDVVTPADMEDKSFTDILRESLVKRSWKSLLGFE